MYQSLFQSRTYKRGPNVHRSYARYTADFISRSVSTGLDSDSVQVGIISSLAIGCKTSGQLLAEKISDLGREFEKNNRSKSRFARIIEGMRKIKKHVKGNPNPNSDKEDLVDVEEVSRSFHGREPREVEDFIQTIEYEDRLAILADLIELQVLTSTGKHIRTISFDKDKPRLTCDATRRNIELIGGDQRLPLKGENAKDLITIGYCVSVAYETDKHHLEDSNGRNEAYEHYFGEEWYKEHGYSGKRFFEKALEDGVVHEASMRGILPLLVYDCRNERILFVGGKYKVEDVGIRN